MGENDVGRRIHEVRAWRGLSLRATAELAGITHGYLAQIERGAELRLDEAEANGREIQVQRVLGLAQVRRPAPARQQLPDGSAAPREGQGTENAPAACR